MERLAPLRHDSLDDVPDPSESLRLFGHADAAASVASAYRAGRLPHALVITGPRGIGKATFAFHLVDHLLGNRDHATAAGSFGSRDPSSPIYRQVAAGGHHAVLYLGRPENDKSTSSKIAFKTVISVDEIRRINRFLSLTSHDGSYRIVIVDPADDLNRNAANALLKNLEEPPARTLFILIAHSPGALLPTIRSRCQILRLEPLGPEDVFGVLEAIGAERPAADQAGAFLERAAGSPRRAILLTQYGGLEIAEATAKLAEAKTVAVSEAHRLADAVAGRDQAIQFSLFNENALDILAEKARAAAESGDQSRASRISEAWERSRVAILEMETYNLDRKQHALSMITRLHDAFRM